MDHTSTFEAYMMFRMTEAEHISRSADCESHCQNLPTDDYEAHLLDAYDRSLVTNSTNWGEW